MMKIKNTFRNVIKLYWQKKRKMMKLNKLKTLRKNY